MMLEESDIKKAAELFVQVERDLGRPLTSHIGDLFADNFDWSVEKCMEMKKSLMSGHGVGAFHLAEARAKMPVAKRSGL